MGTSSSTVFQQVWNYCNVLRDDGISYGDYVEQLTNPCHGRKAHLMLAENPTPPMAGWDWTCNRLP